MTPQQSDAYLARIGIDAFERPTLDALREIQRHHISTVPFENLDVIARRVPLKLDEESLFKKVVMCKRGGICYELNFLLASLLEELGYSVSLLSAIHPRYGDPFDHAFLLVRACDDDRDWMVDVGFGDNFREPLPFPTLEGEWFGDGRDEYQTRPVAGEDHWHELVRRRGGEESITFVFSDIARTHDEYLPRCNWLVTSSDSRFTQGPLICIETPDGRISLTMNRVLNTFNGQKVRTDIKSPEEFRIALSQIFGIDEP